MANPPEFVNFQTEPLVKEALELLHEQLAGNLTKVNELIGVATKDQSGTEGSIKLFEEGTWWTWEAYLGLSKFRFGLEVSRERGELKQHHTLAVTSSLRSPLASNTIH